MKLVVWPGSQKKFGGLSSNFFEAPTAEETTKAPTSISETLNILGAVIHVPTEAMDTEKGSDKGPEKLGLFQLLFQRM